MKGFRSHHHPPSLDFSWRNVRNPAHLRTPALHPKAGETLHLSPPYVPDSRVARRESAGAPRSQNGTLTHGQADYQTESCQKNGDVPRSPFSENGSLMPSAGTIFNLKIDIGSYHRNHRRRHSPRFWEGTP
jgi:hypothetical protein